MKIEYIPNRLGDMDIRLTDQFGTVHIITGSRA
jgi:hypothetical protein